MAQADFAPAERLSPMYQIPPGAVDEEANAAAHLISNISERMRRLATAYGEWEHFDAPAYFDLGYTQTTSLVRIVERVSTVHVVFFIDLLLPSMRSVVNFWGDAVVPAFAQIRVEPNVARHFYDCLQPTLVERWLHLTTVIRTARTLLAEDVGFLTTNAANEERNRWQQWWVTPPLRGLAPELTPPLSAVPTLTLSLDFALPAHRQPGRLRRLRAARDRRRRVPMKNHVAS
jgi:hypothetical protein